MAKPVPIGSRGEAEETVEFRHTLTAHHEELPPVRFEGPGCVERRAQVKSGSPGVVGVEFQPSPAGAPIVLGDFAFAAR